MIYKPSSIHVLPIIITVTFIKTTNYQSKFVSACKKSAHYQFTPEIQQILESQDQKSHTHFLTTTQNY